MDLSPIALLFAAAGIAVLLWHFVQGTRALAEELREGHTEAAGFAGGDTADWSFGAASGSAGHADGGACGADGGGGGHC